MKPNPTMPDNESRSEVRRKNEMKGLIEDGAKWKKWGPYVSEPQWGTVREDYSPTGDTCKYFMHDQARSRAYRWGEDSLTGISDKQQNNVFQAMELGKKAYTIEIKK